MVTEPTEPSSTNNMKDVAMGQRLMIVAIIVNIVAYIIWNKVEILGLVIGLVGLGLAITGVVRATRGLSLSTTRTVIYYIIGLFIPIIALIVLAMVSSEATKALRANGYEVGFFGAKGV